MRRWLIPLLLLINLALPATRLVAASDGSAITDVKAVYDFGHSLVILASVVTLRPIQQVTIYALPENQPDAITIIPTIEPGGRLTAQQDLALNPLPPFGKITYWFHIRYTAGDEFTSPSYVLRYEDTRFEWKVLEERPFLVHWYGSDPSIARQAILAARSGLEKVQEDISFLPTPPLHIYIYSRLEDLRLALPEGDVPWAAGQAIPALGSVFISIASPDDLTALEIRLPEEIAHLILSQKMGTGYKQVPAWLASSLAHRAWQAPDPAGEAALRKAVQSDALLPLSDICYPEPSKTAEQILSSAQADSFLGYLKVMYNAKVSDDLLRAYQDGAGCLPGIENVTGKTMVSLERDWKQKALGINTGLIVLQQLTPFFALLGVLLLPVLFGLIVYLPFGQQEKS